MDAKVSHAEITKRVAACVVDAIIFLSFYLFTLFISSDKSFTEFFNYIFSDTAVISTSIQGEVLETLLFIALETLMITKFGWTPGKLLFGIYIKDVNTLKNVALMQAVIRSTLKVLLLSCISNWFFILPILVLIFATFDQRKQTFYDKTIKTVVIDYKPEKHHLNLNCVGIIRRAVAYIIDHFIIIGISLAFFSFVQMAFDPIKKDANTLKNITLVQATVRYVLFEAFNVFIPCYILSLEEFFNQHNSEQWSGALLTLTFVVIILIFIFAILDKRKQFFYDKIAKTVTIYYKPSR